MAQFLDLAGWIACVVYSTIPSFWLMIHPRAEYWRSRKRSPYFVLLPAWMLMWIIVAVLTARWRHAVLYSTRWSWIPAVFLFAAGFRLYAQSSKNFSAKQLGGLPELISRHNEQQLVTAGIRAHVRHPVYLAHLCEMLAWALGTGLAVCYGLIGLAAITGAIMIRMEDAELEKRFGKAYAVYRERVPALLPRLGRQSSS
ncbi:MAG TPA: isoprenylcysteine carboxylmethyltransferase family protein [Terriglobales bacterium]|nr:isoprenylcysteine carboxylmethyltransferase family protein [Terriglobales bacterium]